MNVWMAASVIRAWGGFVGELCAGGRVATSVYRPRCVTGACELRKCKPSVEEGTGGASGTRRIDSHYLGRLHPPLLRRLSNIFLALANTYGGWSGKPS